MVTRSIQMKIASSRLIRICNRNTNMLRRSGLAFRAVDADPGAIGGSGSQEFMVLADGEDEVLHRRWSVRSECGKAVLLPETGTLTVYNL